MRLRASKSKDVHGEEAVDYMAFGHARRNLSDLERKTTVEIREFSLTAGQKKALVGPSGCGKSTALEMLSLGQVPDEYAKAVLQCAGQFINLDPIYTHNDQSGLSFLRARHFGYVLQSNQLLSFLTVGENVRLSVRLAGLADLGFADAIMDELGIGRLANVMPADISVGQRQRACIARAIAHKPSFIFLDEPTSALDDASSKKVMDLLCSIVSDLDAGVVLITHDLDLAIGHGFEPLAFTGNTVDGNYFARFGAQDGDC